MLLRVFSKLTWLRIAVVAAGLSWSTSAAAAEGKKSTDSTSVQIVEPLPGIEYAYKKPGALHFLTAIPGDYVRFAKYSFIEKHIPVISLLIAETALMIPCDQGIIDGAKSAGESFNLSQESHQHTLFEFDVKFKTKTVKFPFSFPSDANSCMYFLGDGITHTSIAAGFTLFGIIGKSNRALNTGFEIAESMLASGILVQVMKHLSGRESPFVATEPGGKWTVFPNQSTYSDHVPHYDAFPSGHLATAVSTVTVIAENYPEYRLVKPVGYALCGLLSFSMLNNGVHWASDYPLAIGIGYAFAKVVTAAGRTEIKKVASSGKNSKERLSGRPVLFPVSLLGHPALTCRWAF